ncbi:sulfurtransferase [Paenibacillus contaminans]|uniref:Sulfurtransferase n=1 Tax=Paenibacillus contaminans TaxID=450362 RepID=A0A329M8T7_9BACL|nr:sulfurtransferase [Paenibacillus contaminans]RAV15566.1 sulfurtransferase [Paenibacillus contaminans]
MNAIVSKNWVLARLYEPDIVIADCRFLLGKPDVGREAYLEAHIPGAVYLDLEKDLSAPICEHGGRHPLPDIDKFVQSLSKAGIGNDTRVVAYDDQGGAMASRLWWLLRYLGHSTVYVMDEGFSAWQKASFPVSAEQKVIVPASFVPHPQVELVVSVEEVKAKLHTAGTMLIDSREAPRYRGEVEPIDPVAGHIPGAINRFWSEGRRADGSWKSPEEQAERFADLSRDDELIVYCGSGVTACPNVLALTEAGFDKVKLYAGSWSDWISYEGNPVATGEEGKQ